MTTARVFAPAKINLTLHITGQRADGYHLLDSLVVFADVGDQLDLTVKKGETGLVISGREGRELSAEPSNLVQLVADAFWAGSDLGLHLHKELPVASGIGGGSADAAACFRGLRALARAENAPLNAVPNDTLLDMGADIPMCVVSQAMRVRGIGEQIETLNGFPTLWAVLVNPRVPVSTPTIFKNLEKRDTPPMTDLPLSLAPEGVIDWLSQQRNDMQTAAIEQAPEISLVLAELEKQTNCHLARMSGSGATCFGLFPSKNAAQKAASVLLADHPDWWVRPTCLNGPMNCDPQLIRATT